MVVTRTAIFFTGISPSRISSAAAATGGGANAPLRNTRYFVKQKLARGLAVSLSDPVAEMPSVRWFGGSG
jgi:hypothetical protein